MRKHLLLASVLAIAAAAPAHASLTVLQTWVGTYGLSTSGGGSNSGTYTVNAFVPTGATVEAAYLYEAWINNQVAPVPITLDGNAISFDAYVANPTVTPTNFFGMARSDVTSMLAPLIDGGAGGPYSFTVDEGGNTSNIDGTALVVVYNLGSGPQTTVAVLDGFSALDGDSTSLNFATPLDPTAPGFVADMRLGDSFSCCSQTSNVSVNGTLITQNAGNSDDGGSDNGTLITVGDNNDPFSALLPSYADDHERYDLTPYVTAGDTSILVNTNNPSHDDNIFLATFLVSGAAGVNTPPPETGVPEPSTWAMMLFGFGAIGGALRRNRRKQKLAFSQS